MATSSEIQVTEAYIGLLGRAPDPAGLAYWAAELDAAIAAGTSAAGTSAAAAGATLQAVAPRAGRGAWREAAARGGGG